MYCSQNIVQYISNDLHKQNLSYQLKPEELLVFFFLHINENISGMKKVVVKSKIKFGLPLKVPDLVYKYSNVFLKGIKIYL